MKYTTRKTFVISLILLTLGVKSASAGAAGTSQNTADASNSVDNQLTIASNSGDDLNKAFDLGRGIDQLTIEAGDNEFAVIEHPDAIRIYRLCDGRLAYTAKNIETITFINDDKDGTIETSYQFPTDLHLNKADGEETKTL